MSDHYQDEAPPKGSITPRFAPSMCHFIQTFHSSAGRSPHHAMPRFTSLATNPSRLFSGFG